MQSRESGERTPRVMNEIPQWQVRVKEGTILVVSIFGAPRIRVAAPRNCNELCGMHTMHVTRKGAMDIYFPYRFWGDFAVNTVCKEILSDSGCLLIPQQIVFTAYPKKSKR